MNGSTDRVMNDALDAAIDDPAQGPVAREMGAVARLLVALLVTAIGIVVFNRTQDRLGHDAVAASRHAHDVVDLEAHLGLHVEPAASQWLSHHALLAHTGSTIYALVLWLPVLVVVVLAVRDGCLSQYAIASLFVFTALSLLPFWLCPTAPPRLAGIGVVDIARVFPMPGRHPSDEPSLVDINASMPSLHMAWSWWCSSMLRRVNRRSAARAGRRPGRWADLAPLAIPVVVAFDVVFTGNHYLLDIVAGVLLSAVVNAVLLRRVPDGLDQALASPGR